MITIKHQDFHPAYGEYVWESYEYDHEDRHFHELVMQEQLRREVQGDVPLFASEEEENNFWESQELPEPSTPFL